jgi:hypothetical protein
MTLFSHESVLLSSHTDDFQCRLYKKPARICTSVAKVWKFIITVTDLGLADGIVLIFMVHFSKQIIHQGVVSCTVCIWHPLHPTALFSCCSGKAQHFLCPHSAFIQDFAKFRSAALLSQGLRWWTSGNGSTCFFVPEWMVQCQNIWAWTIRGGFFGIPFFTCTEIGNPGIV